MLQLILIYLAQKVILKKRKMMMKIKEMGNQVQIKIVKVQKEVTNPMKTVVELNHPIFTKKSPGFSI